MNGPLGTRGISAADCRFRCYVVNEACFLSGGKAAASLLSIGDKEAQATDMLPPRTTKVQGRPSILAACSVGQGRCTISNNQYLRRRRRRRQIEHSHGTATNPSDLKLTLIDPLQSYPRPYIHAHGSPHFHPPLPRRRTKPGLKLLTDSEDKDKSEDSASTCHFPASTMRSKKTGYQSSPGLSVLFYPLDESSSDEEEGSRLESEENWEMISIRGMHYPVFPK